MFMGAQIRGDWAWLPQPFYQKALWRAVWRSGLADALTRGVTIQELAAERFSPSLVEATLSLLQAQGWVRCRGQRWRWRRHPRGASRAVVQTEAMVRWLTLSDRLRPGSGVEKELSAIELKALSRARAAREGDELVAWLMRCFRPRPKEQWLDVGGGNGALARRLAPRVAGVTLADRPAVIAWLRRRRLPSSIRLWGGDVTRSLPPGRYHGIALVRFCENHPPTVVRSLLASLGSRLYVGGRLWLVGYFRTRHPESDWFALNIAVHAPEGRPYTIGELRQIADAASLQVAEVTHSPRGGYTAIGLVSRRPAPIRTHPGGPPR
jgi:hypothetical protein